MTNEEILQRIAFLLWDDAQLTDEAEKYCKIEGFDPAAYMKQLEEYKVKDKPGIIKTGKMNKTKRMLEEKIYPEYKTHSEIIADEERRYNKWKMEQNISDKD